MGIGNSKKKLITNEEIEKISQHNPTLEKLFNYFKNYDGYISKKDFEMIFYIKIDKRITNKIYKIFAQEKDKFFLEDLKYFYSVMLTRNYQAKINFLAELIFSNNSYKNKTKFQERVKLLFNKQEIENKILNPKFMDRISENKDLNKISKEKFIKCVDSVYEDFFLNFDFLKTIFYSSKTKYKYPMRNLCVCDCWEKEKDKSYNRSDSSHDLNEFIYDKMEIEFRRMEKLNDGLFSLNILERILNEIDVDQKLTNFIIKYLKRKSQRNFLDFKTFKNFMLSFKNEGKIKFLFEILKFPKDFIEKKTLLNLIKNDNKNKNSLNLPNLPDEILLNDFVNLFHNDSSFYEILNYMERINFIPILYFKLRPEDKIVEKNCIEIIMKGEKNIGRFIENIMLNINENDFYCVDIEFWSKWCHYVDWDNKINETKSEENSVSNSYLEIKNIPRIHNDKLIGTFNGRLKEDLIYLKDYVIFNFTMFDLFTRWYLSSGGEIKYKKINYIKEESEIDLINENKNLKIPKIYNKDNSVYEIEINPIYSKYFTFEEIFKNINEYTPEAFKDILIHLNTSKLNLSRVFSFSRKTKYSEIKNQLEKNIKLINQKTNLWIYYRNEIFKADLNRCLEEDKINDFCLFIIETMKENEWLSEILIRKKENNSDLMNNFENKNITQNNYDNSLIGISNIGNTCYMNSILQIFLNLKELKEIFMTKNFPLCINNNNKYGYKGKIIKEFLKLLEEKFHNSENKVLRPIQFKEVIGLVNNQFRNNDQQDAQEFLNFLLDVLHEEINIKDEKEYIPNPEIHDYSEEELSSEYWANNMRRNASFIHSLFLGQLKSNLQCENCNYERTSYETFTNLVIPITQKKTISLEIVFFRIPFIFKAYYKKLNLNEINIKNSLMIIRRQSFDGYSENTKNEEEPPSFSNELYASRLSTSIPLKIVLEIDRKSRIENIIEKLKTITELELENNSDIHLSTYVISTTLEKDFIDIDLKIDECFQNNQTIYVYELLNSKGVNKILNKNKIDDDLNYNIVKKSDSKLNLDLSHINLNYDTPSNNLTPYSKKSTNIEYINTNNNFNTPIHNITEELISLNYETLLKQKSPQTFEKILIQSDFTKMEYLIQIHHRYAIEERNHYLFRKVSFQKLDLFNNFLIVNNSECNLTGRFLYEYIWEKYEYVLNNPSKIKSLIWWQKDLMHETTVKENQYNLENEMKFCQPFVIKILNRENNNCIKCPWYKFCLGCIVDPFSETNLIINPTQIIQVEWCNFIVKNEMNDANLRLILNHESVKTKDEDKSIKSLDECLNLFLEKEYLEGEDQQIFCSKCRQLSNFYKKYDFDRMPPYLILSLKRFKFAKLYKKKIDNLIDFPIYDLEMKGSKYDLYGVINHSGILSAGHYTSTIKINSKWIKCDDSNCYIVDESSIITTGAYILIYKLKEEIQTDYFKMMTYVFNNLDIQIMNLSSENKIDDLDLYKKVFLPGEPIITPYGRAFVIEEIIQNHSKMIKVKFRFGSGVLK